MSNNILIAYYTYSGNTQKIARLILEKTGGELFNIQPKTTYPDSYNIVVEQAKKEIKAGFKPELVSNIDLPETFDTIFVGSPNWWSTIAPPVATFLTENDFSSKTIIPFCTHGGGGLGRIESDINKLCPNSKVLSSFEIYGSGGSSAQSLLVSWLHKLNIMIMPT